MIGQELQEVLEKEAQREGVGLFGVSDINLVARHAGPHPLMSLPFAISLGLPLSRKVIELIEDGPNPLYAHHYKQANYLLDRAALKLSSFIQSWGYEALPIPASQIIDFNSFKGHLSHRLIGYFAGHGSLGLSGLLINPSFGARVRYVTLLTDLPLEPTGPKGEMSSCSQCMKCLHACPAGAIKEERESFDLEACMKQLREFSKRLSSGRQLICGICIKACPGSCS